MNLYLLWKSPCM